MKPPFNDDDTGSYGYDPRDAMADRETELMLKVKAGDRAAFAELFGVFEKPILNYLFRLGRNRALAEDLLQEAFLRVWKAAAAWEPTAKVSTWIFRIAHNLYLNEAARRREKPLEGADETSHLDPSAELHRQELQAAVKKAVDALPEGEREVLLLSEFDGFKYAEISDILGIPVGTVKSRMFSAVQRLKEALKDLRKES
jgi:RNA polymerase sigma-70 factor, ECF subfamily